MKITILVRILWTAGAQKLAISEARELVKMGHEVSLIFLRGSHLSGYDDILQGLRYSVVSADGKSTLSPVFSLITRLFAPARGDESRVDYDLIRRFPRLIEKDKPDLIVCHDHWAGLGGYLAFRKLGVPYSVYYHERVPSYGVPLLGALAIHYETMVLQNAHKVFAVTEKVAASLLENRGVNAVANYFGMDKSYSTNYSAKEQALISTSMWDAGRQPWRYLEILEVLPDFHLYLVGRWRQNGPRKYFHDEVQRKDLTKRVTVAEGVSEEVLHQYYAKSKFYVRFGYREFGCGSTPEAVQHSVPPVINKDFGTSGLIEEYSAGCVLTEPDPIAAARFISEHDNPAAYGTLQANLARLSADYTIRKHCELLIS